MDSDLLRRAPMWAVALALVAGYSYHVFPIGRELQDAGFTVVFGLHAVAWLFVLATFRDLARGEFFGIVYLIPVGLVEGGLWFSRQSFAGPVLKIGGGAIVLGIVGLVIRARMRSGQGTAEEST